MSVKIGFNSICAKEWKSKMPVRPHQLPIYATSSFEFDTIEQGINIFKGTEEGHKYSRYGNPTVDAVAEKIARLECYGLDMEAEAIMVSSGMSAISTLVLGLLKAGDKILTQGNLYGGTTNLFLTIFEPLGIECILTDLQDLEQVDAILASDPAIKLLYFETPANPTMTVVDMAALCRLAQKHEAFTAVDSTFCTPYLQQPFQFGLDFIVHSTTKFLNGHGNSTSGIIIGKDKELMSQKIWVAMKLAGTNCNPFDAWMLNNGLKTLGLRMEKHSDNAMSIATYLEAHPKVEKVNYNGLSSHPDHEIAKKQMKRFGGMLSFELKGGFEAGVQFMNNLELCTLAPTLGDVDTLVLHPASSSHINVPKETREKNGITDGLIRLSVGIEDEADLIADLAQAIG